MAKTVMAASTALFPVPAVMISSRGVEGAPNVITVAWVGTVCSEPPMVAIGVRPSRHSHHLIMETKEFVVNIPSADQVTAMDYCGLVSGSEHEKFAECGFTAAAASKLQHAPLIGECPANLECQVKQVIHLGSHDLFLAEVVAVQAEESLVERNRINPVASKPVSYANGTYYGLGEMIGRGGIGKQMKKQG